ncbi:MAG TPA: hypothetical protein VMT53_08560, partial [Terriglobales bacterium]|nr:hypothetical protein [Terriglobales bacterium]
PSPITSTSDPFLTHVHSDFYEKARKYVENGGSLYASFASDGAVPEMASLFGARLVDRAPSTEVTIKMVKPFGDLKPGDTFHYLVPDQTIESWGAILQVLGGKVIAVDQHNNPALIVNTVGRGKTLLSAYPVEHYLANVPAVFDQAENTHRIYEAFRDWVGFKSAFQTDDPAIEISALNGDHRGYLVVVNHSAEGKNVMISAAAPVHTISRIAPEGVTPVSLQGFAFKLQLGPYDGTILEWK